jgi:hypothetical protein
MACAVLMAGIVATTVAVASGKDGDRGKRSGYEVWMIDQSDTRAPTTGPLGSGGNLYVYQGSELEREASTAEPEKIDLGGAASELCLEQTGSSPTRPHMIVFNGGDDSADGNERLAVSFVASGHVLFMESDTREPIECIDTGVQAHSMWPTRDQTQLIVANQADKKLSRISTDWEADKYEVEEEATLDLANGTTPSGAPRQDSALRPNNQPICPRTDDEGRVTFVTLAGGGMFVVDHAQTPMAIVAEYDKTQVHPNGCGGIESKGKSDGTMYINSGAGPPASNPTEHDVYAFDVDAFDSEPNPPNTPAPRLVYSYDDRAEADSHGVVLAGRQDRYLWTGDRQSNTMTVVDTRNDRVIEEFTLEGEISNDPAPDLLDVSPDGDHVFAALRGSQPLSGGHFAAGNTPGIGVIDVRGGGREGRLDSVARVSNITGGRDMADPHGIRVRVLNDDRDRDRDRDGREDDEDDDRPGRGR